MDLRRALFDGGSADTAAGAGGGGGGGISKNGKLCDVRLSSDVLRVFKCFQFQNLCDNSILFVSKYLKCLLLVNKTLLCD